MNPVIMLTTTLFILIILCGINYYIARRLYQCFNYLFPHIPFGLYIGIVLFLILIMILGFVRSFLPISEPLKHILKIASSYGMGIFVYLLIFLVLTDIILFLGHITKLIPLTLPNVRFISGIIALSATILTSGYGFYHAQQLKIVSYDIQIQEKSLANDWNIILISDVHLGAVASEKRLEKIVQEVNSLNPDLVCIAGDIFDNDYAAIQNPEKAIETLKQLKSNHGIYACLGNHDAGTTISEMKIFLDRCGIQILNDAYTMIENELILVGRLDPSPIGGFGDMKRKNVEEVLSGIDTSLPILIMDHNPIHIEEYGSDVNLIVSGHTHKGQIFPGSIFTNLMYTIDHGYYRKDSNSPHVIVTSGVGTWGMPMRVGTDCEIVQITLKLCP